MKIYLVGGSVRDTIMGRPSNDRDFVVVGATEAEFVEEFPNAKKVGKDFPVYLVDGEEFAFARKERKTGAGHTSFETISDPSITLEEDLARRDLTINAIAMDIDNGSFIDPFYGERDIIERVLHHVSPAFSEDPLRVFRVARFAATLGFTVAQETIELMRSLKGELSTLSGERVFCELKKALNGENPRAFFDILKRTNCLEQWFPEVAALIGVEQPWLYHPEGDTYEHTMCVLNGATDSLARFGALCHDLGKALTPSDEWPKHHGHDERGEVPVRSLCNRLKVPGIWKDVAIKAATLHMKLFSTLRPGKLIKLTKQISCYWPHLKEILEADAMSETDCKLTQEAILRIEKAIDNAPSYALSDLDADTLSKMCDEFRAEIFEKAGKEDPRNRQEEGLR